MSLALRAANDERVSLGRGISGVVKTIRLVDIEGPTAIHLDVQITDQGDLLFSGQDLGEAPEMVFGDSDHEYWLTVAKRDKDSLLLALIEKHYAGNASVISVLQETLDSRGIPYEFQSYS
jgi:hypothetical protein